MEFMGSSQTHFCVLGKDFSWISWLVGLRPPPVLRRRNRRAGLQRVSWQLAGVFQDGELFGGPVQAVGAPGGQFVPGLHQITHAQGFVPRLPGPQQHVQRVGGQLVCQLLEGGRIDGFQAAPCQDGTDDQPGDVRQQQGAERDQCAPEIRVVALQQGGGFRPHDMVSGIIDAVAEGQQSVQCVIPQQGDHHDQNGGQDPRCGGELEQDSAQQSVVPAAGRFFSFQFHEPYFRLNMH